MVKFDTTRHVFGTSAAPKTLLDLFAGQRQLIVLQFMDNGPDDYCPGCTNFTSNAVGLAALAGTGVSWATVSNTPLAQIEACKARMGWTMPSVSSRGTTFADDCGKGGEAPYSGRRRSTMGAFRLGEPVPRRREALVVVAALAVLVLGGVVLIVGGVTGSGHPAIAVGARSPAGVAASLPDAPGAAAAGAAGASDRQAGGAALCNSQRLAVDGGVYTVQNNEWGSGAAECLAAGGPAGFTVTRSAIANSTSGAPGGYPSIYRGCHWGACTPDSGLPVPVSRLLSPGTVTTTWATAQPRTGAYDVAYDIWFNRAPSTSGQPDGAELMIWLNHNGPVQPFGSQVSTAAIGGRSYDVWFGKQAWNTITYSMVTGTTSVRDLDIGQFAADALRRGYIQKSWYLTDVEAGFELWQGGAGLATDSFAVNVPGGSSAPIAAGAAGAAA